MALRLDSAVIRGELDNTSRGNVRGKLWLVGREEPVMLDLRGDAWRDVAGSRITFVNASPSAQSAAVALQSKQMGYVGDITASRKVRSTSGDDPEPGPEDALSPRLGGWCNSLYLEWFSEQNGRVFIEGTSFEITVSEWLWEMDAAAEEAQKRTNLQAMRDWLAGVIRRPEPKLIEEDDFDDSEESWEESLKLSDRLGDAHMEALEKYGEESFDDDRISFVMGWDHMLGGDKGDHGVEDDEDEWMSAVDLMPEDDDEIDPEGGYIDEESPDCHPLQKRSHELVVRLLTELEEDDEQDKQSSDGHTPLDRFIRNTMNISGKLAGVLGIRGFGGSRDKGHTLAVLRRCLNWANEALAGLNELSESAQWQDRLELLDEFRAELFALRDGMTDLRKELRES